MGRFLVRITILITTIHFLYAFYMAQYAGIDVLGDWHTTLFELCVVVYCFSSGSYHCQYIKTLSVAILATDTLTRLDLKYDFLSTDAHNLIPLWIMSLAIVYTLYLAIRHFIKATKLKNQRNNVSNKRNAG